MDTQDLAEKKRARSLAKASFILGILSLMSFSVAFAIPALITGDLAIKLDHENENKGMANTGRILGTISIISSIIAIILLIVIVNGTRN